MNQNILIFGFVKLQVYINWSKLMDSLSLNSTEIALVLVSVKIEPFTAISNIDDQIIIIVS